MGKAGKKKISKKSQKKQKKIQHIGDKIFLQCAKAWQQT